MLLEFACGGELFSYLRNAGAVLVLFLTIVFCCIFLQECLESILQNALKTDEKHFCMFQVSQTVLLYHV